MEKLVWSHEVIGWQTIDIHCYRDPKKGVVNNQILDWSFKVDGVLHNASQEKVFETVAVDVIRAALDGFNGQYWHWCITLYELFLIILLKLYIYIYIHTLLQYMYCIYWLCFC